MKRNSADSSHPLLQGQQDSKIKGVKNIGIISTPIIWPVRQRPLHPSKSPSAEEQNPERKNMYNLFPLYTFEATSPASGEPEVGSLVPFKENIGIEHNIAMNLSISKSISNNPSSFLSETHDIEQILTTPISTDYSKNVVVPPLQTGSFGAELTWTLPNALEYLYPNSESAFQSPVSKNALNGHTKESLWIFSSSTHESTHGVLESSIWWSKATSYHRVTPDIPKENYHSQSNLFVSSTQELMYQKSRLDLPKFTLSNTHLLPTKRIIEDPFRNGPYIPALNDELQSTRAKYSKEQHSVDHTNLTPKQSQPSTPSHFFQNMQEVHTEVMPDIQSHILLTREHSTELVKWPLLLLGTSKTSSESQHAVTTVSVYQESFNNEYLKSDLFPVRPLTKLPKEQNDKSSPEQEFELNTGIYNINDMPHSLKPLTNLQRKPNEIPGIEILEDNLNAIHNDNLQDDSVISTQESDNRRNSLKQGHMVIPAQYVDIAPSLLGNYWTMYYHFKQETPRFSGEPAERGSFLFNKPLLSPTERLPFVSSPTELDSIPIQTTTINLSGYVIKEVNFASSVPSLTMESSSSVVVIPSLKISKKAERTASELKSIMAVSSNINVFASDTFSFDSPFPSLETSSSKPFIHLQTTTTDIAQTIFTNILTSLTMKTWDESVHDNQVNMAFQQHRQTFASILRAHTTVQPSCTRNNHTSCMANKSALSSVSDEAKVPSVLQTIMESTSGTTVIEHEKNNAQTNLELDFSDTYSSPSSNSFIMPLSLETTHHLHSEQKIRSRISPNSYSTAFVFSTPPLSQDLPNYFDQVSPSLSYLQNVGIKSHLTILGQKSVEDGDSILTSSQTAQMGIIYDDVNSRSATSNTELGFSRGESKWEVYSSFNKHTEQFIQKGMSSLTTSSIHVSDLQLQTIPQTFEDYAGYGKLANLSSVLEPTRISDLTSTIFLSSPHLGTIIHDSENILNYTLMINGAASIRHSVLQSQISASPVKYHQSSISAHANSLANLSASASQNSTPYTPLNLLTSSPKSILSCLCNSFADLNCPCGPEAKYSMSRH